MQVYVYLDQFKDQFKNLLFLAYIFSLEWLDKKGWRWILVVCFKKRKSCVGKVLDRLG